MDTVYLHINKKTIRSILVRLNRKLLIGGDGVMHNRHHSTTTKKTLSNKRNQQIFSEESQLKKMNTMYGFTFNGIICTDKNGESFYYRTVKDFCMEHNGDSGHVNKVLQGKRKTHKGFSISFA